LSQLVGKAMRFHRMRRLRRIQTPLQDVLYAGGQAAHTHARLVITMSARLAMMALDSVLATSSSAQRLFQPVVLVQTALMMCSLVGQEQFAQWTGRAMQHQVC